VKASSGPPALAEIAALFTASPRVVTEEQPGSGHNLSLGLAAPAYHLKVLAFAEECALAREDQSGAGTSRPGSGRSGDPAAARGS